MTQIELLKLGKQILEQNEIYEADFKAKKLLEFILGQSNEKLIANSLNEVGKVKEKEYDDGLNAIISGKPLQYITHNQEFMGLNFYVDENVLIPQPDTELLVEETINILKEEIKQKASGSIGNEIKVLDLCTGSGAIAISIAKYVKNIKVFASDISRSALEIAKENAIQNEVNIEFIYSDMFSNLEDYRFDIIVSNPPYIKTNVIKTLSKEVQSEPSLALDGGEDGLRFYNLILSEATKHLNENGHLLFEIGYDQGEKILSLYKSLKEQDNCNVELVSGPIKDLGGNDRVMIFKRR